MPVKKKIVSSKLAGQSVLFTGFRDAGLEHDIETNGGTVATGPAKATILLAKDPNGTSSKLKAARDRNIPVMTVDAFRRKYRL